MEAKNYRKKPVTIQAMQLTPENAAEIAKWVGGDVQLEGNEVVIITLEGNMRADVGDYIIRGVKGEYYPCKPDIFWATYEFAQTEQNE